MKRTHFLKKQHVSIHRSGRFENPLFEERRVRARVKARIAISLSAVIVIVAPIVILLTPMFRITAVNITGLTTIEPSSIKNLVDETLADKRFGIFPQYQRAFFPTLQLTDELQNRYDFEDLDITLKNRSINIHAQERISELVWRRANEYVFVDLNGRIIRPLDADEMQIIEARERGEAVAEHLQKKLQPNMPIIADTTNTELDGVGEIMSATYAQHIVEFDKGVRGLAIEPHIYQSEGHNSPWYRLKTRSGYDILFDAQNPPRAQIDILRIVLTEQKERLNGAQYIDIRFGNNVYIR